MPYMPSVNEILGKSEPAQRATTSFRRSGKADSRAGNSSCFNSQNPRGERSTRWPECYVFAGETNFSGIAVSEIRFALSGEVIES